jgi:hypothetical protein
VWLCLLLLLVRVLEELLLRWRFLLLRLLLEERLLLQMWVFHEEMLLRGGPK